MVGVSGHLHETQAGRQKTQVPKNVRGRLGGPSPARPRRHVEVQPQKPGISMDPHRNRNSLEVRFRISGRKEGHVAHDRGGFEPPRGVQDRFRKVLQRRSVRRREGVSQRGGKEPPRRQENKIFFDKVRQKSSRRRKVQPNLEDDDVEIFFQKQNLRLARRPRQTHRKLQQHEAQEHRDEADRGQRGKRIRGLEKTFRRGEGLQETRVQDGGLGEDPQVQKHFLQGVGAEFYERSFQSQKRSQRRPQRVRLGRPRRGTDHRKILRTGALENKRWLTQTQEKLGKKSSSRNSKHRTLKKTSKTRKQTLTTTMMKTLSGTTAFSFRVVRRGSA